MFTHPLILLPLMALGLTLAWTAWRPGALPAAFVLGCTALLLTMLAQRATAQQRRASQQAQALAQRCAEQQAAIDRAESARAAAQAETRALEERYALAVRGSQDGLWEWDIATGAVQLSPRWKGMLGYEPNELADDAAAWRRCIHPEDRPAHEQALTQHLAGADVRFERELRLLHKDGSVRWVLSRGVALRRAGGAVYRLVGMDVDVTRVRRVQTVLEAVADGTAGTFGEPFFEAMVQHFARALNVGRAFITECADHPVTRVRTLAAWSAGKLQQNFDYALAGTPCEAVVEGQQTCFHRSGLAQLFPREAGWEAFLGMPIIASDGRLLGHLAFFNATPLDDDMLVDPVYRIFVARAAAEIERMQALDLLRSRG